MKALRNIKRLVPKRTDGLGRMLLIVGLCLLPIIGAAVFVATRDNSTGKPDTDVSRDGVVIPQSGQIGNEKFLELPGSGGYTNPEEARPGVAETVVMPKVQGVGVTGGKDWSNRNKAVSSSIAFARDLAAVDPRRPAPTFKRMRAYMAAGAVETARGLVDHTAPANSSKRPKLKYLFLYRDEQTNAQVGKLVYNDQTFFQVEYDDAGKILLLTL